MVYDRGLRRKQELLPESDKVVDNSDLTYYNTKKIINPVECKFCFGSGLVIFKSNNHTCPECFGKGKIEK